MATTTRKAKDPNRPPTPNQIHWVTTCLADRQLPPTSTDPDDRLLLGTVGLWQDEEVTNTFAMASYLLDHLFNLPRKPRENAATTEGFYLLQGDDGQVIYRTKLSKAGNLYALRLVIDEGSKSGRWEYESGGVLNLTQAMAITDEEAGDLGAHYSICIECGATLTDPKSRGIGPVCAKKVRRRAELAAAAAA